MSNCLNSAKMHFPVSWKFPVESSVPIRVKYRREKLRFAKPRVPRPVLFAQHHSAGRGRVAGGLCICRIFLEDVNFPLALHERGGARRVHMENVESEFPMNYIAINYRRTIHFPSVRPARMNSSGRSRGKERAEVQATPRVSQSCSDHSNRSTMTS